MAVSVVANDARSITTATRSPFLTFSGYTPALNDVVVLFSAASGTGPSYNATPAGWVQATGIVGGQLTAGSSFKMAGGLYHLVTSGEVSAVTTTYTATNYLAVAFANVAFGCVLRGADPADVVDSYDSATPALGATQKMPGANLSIANANGMWLSALAKSNDTVYGSLNGSWTQVTSLAGPTGNLGATTLVRRNTTVSPADNPLSDVNHGTADVSQYAAVSIVISELAAPATNTGAFFAMF